MMDARHAVDEAATIESDNKRQNSALSSPSATPMASWEAILPIAGQQPLGSQGSGTNSLPATALTPGPVVAAAPNIVTDIVMSIEDAVHSALQPCVPMPGIDLTSMRFVMPSSSSAAALPQWETGPSKVNLD